MGYVAPLTGYTTILPGQARSGTLTKTGTIPQNLGFNQVSFQILTDQSWSTYTDGRRIIFSFAFSFDGGQTFPWTEGPFGVEPPGSLSKNGSPMMGVWFPSDANAWQATYAVEDAGGNVGPTIDFGVAAAPIVVG
jgi:hypothetical protein